MAWRRVRGPILSFCVSIGLGGCIGDSAGPSPEADQSQPIHGVWYTELQAYGYPVERYDFWEYEYRPDGRVIMRDHDFHLDSLTGHLVLDSIKALPQRMTYSLDGDILSESYYHPESDTLVHIERLLYAIAGDSLSERFCTVLSGNGTGLEGRWETRHPSLSGYNREVVLFREGMFSDSVFFAADPPVGSEPRPYQVADDSTVALGSNESSGQDTLRYRLRKGKLIILQGLRPVMFRTRPELP